MLLTALTSRTLGLRYAKLSPPLTGGPSGIPGSIIITDPDTGLELPGLQLGSGQTKQLGTEVRDAANGSIISGLTVTWVSSNPAAATVNSSGLVSYAGNGSTTITASVNSAGGNPVADTVAITASAPAAVASVAQSTATLAGVAGTQATFTVQPKDAGGNNLSGRVVTVDTNNHAIATASISGYTVTVTFVAAGTCTCTATCETVASSGVALTTNAAGGAYPSKPGDITTLQAYADDEGSQMSALTLNTILQPSGWTGFTRKSKGSAANFAGGTGSGLPASKTRRLRTQWPSGIVSTGSVTWELWPGGLSAAGRRRLSLLYFSMWFQFPGTNFENNQSGVKLIYLGHGQNPGTSSLNSIIMIRQGGVHDDSNTGNATGLYSAMRFHWYRNNYASGTQQFTSDTTGTTGTERILMPNINSGNLITCGTWHQLEVEARMNTSTSAGDGVMKMSLDGVLFMHYTNIFFKTAGNTENFTGWEFDNTWGGGGAARTRADNLDIAEVAIYGET